MSEIPPPVNPEQGPPPQQYAAYPRLQQGAAFGDPDKLQALADGYFGLNMVFLLNILLAVAANGVVTLTEEPVVWLIVLPVLLIVIIAATLPPNKKIAFGKGWAPSGAWIASILMGLNSAFCCGIIGYVVMQMIAIDEMKKYGIKGGSFSLKKKAVQEQIQLLRQSQTPTPPYQTTDNA